MRKGLLGSFFVLLSAAGWSFGQAPPPLAGHGPDLMPAWTDDGHAAFSSDRDGGSGTCLWGGADYLLWWIKDQPLPPFLVLTGDPTTNNPGALNAGGIPVTNNARINYGGLSGVRATVGGWLGGDGGLGIEGVGFLLPQQSKTLTYASNAAGSPVFGFRYLDTPFNTNPATGPEDVFQASVPAGNTFGVGPFAGSATIATSTRLWGTELNGVLGAGDGNRLQLLAGFRYVDLSEDLSLLLRSTALDGGTVNFLGGAFGPPSTVTSTDTFRTRNQFYGGQVGFRSEFGAGGLIIGVTSKIALGNMHEVVEVRGLSTLSPDFQSVPTGQFAGPSNIGRSTRDEFAVIPEFEIKAGYRISSCLRATIGYDFLYISRVVRPGSQIDLVVNDTTNPLNGNFHGLNGSAIDTSAFPRPFFNRSDFWAQGLTFGLELTF